MHDRQPRNEGNTDLHEREPRPPRDREHQRDKQDESHLEEHRNADDEGDDHDRPVHSGFTESRDECGGDAGRRTRLGHHLAQHRAERDDDRDESEDRADAILECLHDSPERHAGDDSQGEGDRDQGDEGVQLEPRDQDDQRHDRRGCQEQQLRVCAHTARLTRSATITSGDSRISQTHARSSGAGSSSVVSWLSSSDAGMKCPRRLARRSASSSRLPAR